MSDIDIFLKTNTLSIVSLLSQYGSMCNQSDIFIMYCAYQLLRTARYIAACTNVIYWHKYHFVPNTSGVHVTHVSIFKLIICIGTRENILSLNNSPYHEVKYPWSSMPAWWMVFSECARMVISECARMSVLAYMYDACVISFE